MSRIVGFIKFSDFKSSNGKAHFQELIKGNVFFQDYKWFGENGSIAQQAEEGSASRVAFLQNRNPIYVRHDYTIFSPVGIRYLNQKDRNLIFIAVNFLDELDVYSEEKVRQKIEDECVPSLIEHKSDVVIYPSRFKIKSFNPMGEPIYDFDELTIKLVNPDAATWRISCFVTVYESDITPEGNLSQTFIDSLLDTSSEKGSIALDDLGRLRPWVWIPFGVLCRGIQKIKGIKSGIVKYYKSKEYPFNKNDILVNPNKLLFAKGEEYETQKEFRLVVGEVNSQYSQVCPKRIVRFYWGSYIDHGVTLDELKNLLVTKDIKKCRKKYTLNSSVALKTLS